MDTRPSSASLQSTLEYFTAVSADCDLQRQLHSSSPSWQLLVLPLGTCLRLHGRSAR